MARYLSVFSFKQKEPAHLFIHYNRRLQVPSDGLDVGTGSIPVCPRVCVASRVPAWCMAGSPPYARGLPVLVCGQGCGPSPYVRGLRPAMALRRHNVRFIPVSRGLHGEHLRGNLRPWSIPVGSNFSSARMKDEGRAFVGPPLVVPFLKAWGPTAAKAPRLLPLSWAVSHMPVCWAREAGGMVASAAMMVWSFRRMYSIPYGRFRS